MLRENVDRGWMFSRNQPNFLSGKPAAEVVDLPHDYSINLKTYPESSGGTGHAYYDGGVGIYEKDIFVPKQQEGNQVLLEIAGAYMNSSISVNGNLVMRYHHGYTSFHADLTPYIRFGEENRITITTNNHLPSSRWYSGSGLYRSVELLTGGPIHIMPWGIYAHLDYVTGDTAFVIVEVEAENQTRDAKEVWADLKFYDGDRVAATGKSRIYLPAGEKTTAKMKIAVEDYKPWTPDTPNLYQIVAEISDEGKILDQDRTSFGIRTMTVDAKNGLLLNGQNIKIKGGCIHHDNGILGAASFKDSEYRRIRIMKEAGFNAVRCAHNPPSREMLEACDELGMMVMDEAFDCWNNSKSPNDFGMFFNDDWEKVIRSMVVRDRNHPCIIMWSIGNEIYERNGNSEGYRWAYRLAEKVREYDQTRPITNGINALVDVPGHEEINRKIREEMKEARKNCTSFFVPNGMLPYASQIWCEYTESFTSPLDVVGYNYLDNVYESNASAYPDRVMVGTESYADMIDVIWDKVQRMPQVLGDFVWAGYDYLGETGIGAVYYIEPDADPIHRGMDWPMRLANVGDIDICGFRRPQLYYRRIVWGSGETYIASHHPEHYGLKELRTNWGWPVCDHSWTWKGSEGKPVEVEVYTAADEVELCLNGTSLGRKPAGKANRYKASFDVIYEPGVLEAISYLNEKEVSRDRIETAGEPCSLNVQLNRDIAPADGHSLIFAEIEIVDAHGNRVPDAEIAVSAEITGAASFVALGAARPATTENYTTGRFTSYQGRALAIFRTGYDAGEAMIILKGEGMKETSKSISIVSCS